LRATIVELLLSLRKQRFQPLRFLAVARGVMRSISALVWIRCWSSSRRAFSSSWRVRSSSSCSRFTSSALGPGCDSRLTVPFNPAALR
jgi:hypothetical protein